MAKLVLSEKEWNTVQNFDFLLTKNEVINKMQQFLTHIGNEYMEISYPFLEADNALYFQISPKVSKGEKYEGLPYLMLDFPRYFHQENTFAIRTFFLWGKVFSITLLLEGNCKKQLQTKLFENPLLHNWLYETDNSPWIHLQSDYKLHQFSTISTSQLDKHPFLKLSLFQPLHEWQNIETFFRQSFHKIMEACFG